MIKYKRGGIYFLLNVCKRGGSVFPFALMMAVPCAAATFGMKQLILLGYLPGLDRPDGESILKDNASWSGFMFLVGFLIVFRTSQAYARFWEGCTAIHTMRAEWLDACCSVISFCTYSKAAPDEVDKFMHTFVRLFSMLHASALAEIEDSNSDEPSAVNAFSYELLDPSSINDDSLRAVKESESKVELVFQWIQTLIVEHIETEVLSIPAPILSRGFQQLGNGMVQFHDAIKISTVPFPFPYAQTCDCLLLIHWLITPLVVAQWVTEPWWGAIFSFLQVFIYWCLNLIAVEIENPFGEDDNDIDAHSLQREFNQHLILLVSPVSRRTPTLKAKDARKFDANLHLDRLTMERQSFLRVWTELEDGRMSQALPAQSARRLCRGHSCASEDTFWDSEQSKLAALSALARPRRLSLHSAFSSVPETSQENLGEVAQVRRHSVASTGSVASSGGPGDKGAGGERRGSFGFGARMRVSAPASAIAASTRMYDLRPSRPSAAEQAGAAENFEGADAAQLRMQDISIVTGSSASGDGGGAAAGGGAGETIGEGMSPVDGQARDARGPRAGSPAGRRAAGGGAGGSPPPMAGDTGDVVAVEAQVLTVGNV